MAQNTPTSILNFANLVRLEIDRRQMAGNTFLLKLCKFIVTCLPEKVKNSAVDWQIDIISWPRNTKWWTVELYKKKHVALLIIAKFLATTPVMATTTLQICIFKHWENVVKLSSCNFNWCTLSFHDCCSGPFHDVKCHVLQLFGRQFLFCSVWDLFQFSWKFPKISLEQK